MFRPSTSLLFRPMPVLNKLKIHQPLPLSPRESEQLLNLLTTSFRHNLDTEHPSFGTADHGSRMTRPSAKPRRRSFSDFDGHHTDRHMHSLLSNPLFTPPTRNRIIGRDPMEIFDLAVAQGMMDTNHAKACLNAKRHRIIQSSVLSVRDGMRDSGAGMKVLRWLTSSGTSNDNQFLKDQDFAEILVAYMVAEGLQEHAWRWIKRSFKDVSAVALLPFGAASKTARREVAGPLRALVKSEMSQNRSFDAAYMCISRAAGYLKRVSSAEMTTALQPAGMLILNRTCMPTNFAPHPTPSEVTFESFVSLVPIISPRKYNRYLAHLALLHPTKPDPGLALDYLQNIESSVDSDKLWALQPKDKKASVIQLGLDAAKVLLEQGRHSDMEWTMEFLSKNFPQQLGLNQRRQLEQVKAEASSIELLESIGIA
ncbi:uncharacterized protein LY89DRAFT_346891 [Mollisia scopiformis]|uniref:Uncharacterized protein n=1 Tax=Mollisia scopiformis TaxID=149040 RepID=A0A132B6F4_MOLSC|nr:uncharacterized protein LY89DRAFT_346891 [Mollisia scopiformis]KUJ07986.1 hypothetical protein LY89DRAFT_346891 [Mollisia scopiformis]